MCQTPFYIPALLWGFPLFGTEGILFWLTGVVTVIAILRRIWLGGWKWDADCTNYVQLGGLALIVFAVVVPKVMTADGFPIRGYGCFLLLAIVASFGLLYWRLKRLNYFSTDLLFQMVIVSIVCGIVGARIFYVTEYWQSMLVTDSTSGKIAFGQTLLNIVNIAEGGLVVYGSAIGGILACVCFVLYHRLPLLKTLDLVAPSMLLGVAIGRFGCLMNGCCFGGVCPDTAFLALHFPNASPVHYNQVQRGMVPLYGITFGDDKKGNVNVQSVEPNSPAANANITPSMPVAGIGWIDGEATTVIPVSTREQAALALLDITANGSAIIRFGCDGRPACVCQECSQLKGKGQPPIHTLSNAAMSAQKICIITDSQQQPVLLKRQRNDKPLPVYPTQIYSAVGNLALCLFLLTLAHFSKRDGEVFAFMLITYAQLRFCIEIVRDDEMSFMGTGFTVSQNVSFVFFGCGLALLTAIMTRSRKKTQ
ncbi:MAG: prolipoprotein diacylglyceryl transferase [Planctomycetaceae bacterium]|jgi:phosphatidylglycerol:prolipoprotein diacylglycerol transferase|nr:prolipoprotein diacylglyceryl transferase [Planctomycetaceae bacterium]